MQCPEPGCEELVEQQELEEHLSIHCIAQQILADEEQALAPASRSSAPPRSPLKPGQKASSSSNSNSRSNSARANRSSASSIVSGMYHSLTGRKDDGGGAGGAESPRKLKRKTEDRGAQEQQQPQKKISLARAFFYGIEGSQAKSKWRFEDSSRPRELQREPKRAKDSIRLGVSVSFWFFILFLPFFRC